MDINEKFIEALKSNNARCSKQCKALLKAHHELFQAATNYLNEVQHHSNCNIALDWSEKSHCSCGASELKQLLDFQEKELYWSKNL